MMNQFEAVRWRQVHPADARISPTSRASLRRQLDHRPHANADDTLPPQDGSISIPQTPFGVIAPPDVVQGDIRRMDRPTLLTKGASHSQAREAENSLASPHTPSTEQRRSAYDQGRLRLDTRSTPYGVGDLHEPYQSSADSRKQSIVSIPVQDQRAHHHASPDRLPGPTQPSPMSLPSFAAFRESTQPYLAQSSTSYTTGFVSAPGDVPKRRNECACADLIPMIQAASDAAMKLSLALKKRFFQLEAHRMLDDVISRSPSQALQQLTDYLLSAELSLACHDDESRRTSICTACKTPIDPRLPAIQLKRPAVGDTGPIESHSKRPKYERGSPPLPHARRASSSSSTLRPGEILRPMPQSGTQSTPLLPSPSSLVNPMTNYASASRIGQSPSPPATTSQHNSSSLHNVSTTSAASQHIANLEHTVTLKSLSLQSLQAEHTNLLQKWQRERVKIQTIEKKRVASDNEINDLAARNDELVEQVKSLETQLVTAEQKRDQLTAATAQEKDQWGRMLEMSDRLQHRAQQACHRLQEENAQLIRSLSSPSSDTRDAGQLEQLTSRVATTEVMSREPCPRPDPSASITSALQSRVQTLRAALEVVSRHNSIIQQNARETKAECLSIADLIVTALDDGVSEHLHHLQHGPGARSDDGLQFEQSMPERPDVLRSNSTVRSSSDGKSSPRIKAIPPRSSASATVEALLAATSNYSMSDVDLGFRIIPSTSSPEELVKALAPAPLVADIKQ